MYEVLIFHKNECIDARDFEIGTWGEIAFWLDNYGYIDKEYEIKVRIS